MKKTAVISTVVALLLICAGTGACLLLGSPFSHKGQANVVRQPLSTVSRSEEVPYSTHRALSLVANKQTTALLPWGIALDSLNGFIWVAEPGCQPDVQCPATQPGVLGQTPSQMAPSFKISPNRMDIQVRSLRPSIRMGMCGLHSLIVTRLGIYST